MNSWNVFFSVFFLTILTFGVKANQSELLDYYFDNDLYRQVELSPNGKHLGLLKENGSSRELIIVDASTLSAFNVISLKSTDKINSFTWLNEKRVLLNLGSKVRNQERRENYGELYAINIDGKDGKFIFGYRSLFRNKRLKPTSTGNTFQTNFALATVLDTLPNDPDHIMIRSDEVRGDNVWVYRLNIHSGNQETIALLEREVGDIVYSRKSKELWHLFYSNKENELLMQRFDFKDESWIDFKFTDFDDELVIVKYSEQLNGLILRGYCGKVTLGLCLFNPKTKSFASMFHNAKYDINQFLFNESDRLISVSLKSDFPTWHPLFDRPDATFLSDIQKQFNGAFLSFSRDAIQEKKALFRISGDRIPRQWYLLDRKTNKFKLIATSRKNTEPGYSMFSFNYNSKDGLPLQGYITMPKMEIHAPAPAVLLVHGGPFGTRDYWGFSTRAQYLASIGYATVQINYRGSTGKGRNFEAAGYQNWGGAIQTDLIQGLDYLISQNLIAKDKVCVMGASFGGYSAIRLNTLFPNRFKCGIATAGVYDLEELVDDKDDPELIFYLEETLGDEKIQKDHSVLNHVDKIKAPLLIAHGTKDRVADFEQYEELKDALEKNGIQFESLELGKEGHYFYNPEKRKQYYKKVTEFLLKNNPPN